MKLFKTCVLVSMTLLVASCNNTKSTTTPQNLPSNITQVVFTKRVDNTVNPGPTSSYFTHTITIDLSASPYAGTAVFQSTATGGSNCSLTLNLTSTQSTDFLTYLTAITYTPGQSGGGCDLPPVGINTMTVTSSSGQLILGTSGCTTTNPFDPTGIEDNLYALIKSIVQANIGYSACASEWQYLF